MQLAPLPLQTIEQEMDRIKKDRSHPVFTNYCKQPMSSPVTPAWIDAHSVLFINREMDFYRLYFYTSWLEEFAVALKQAKVLVPVVMACVARQLEPGVADAFVGAGFRPYAVFVRLVTYDFRAYEKNSRLEYAQPVDLDPLWNQLMEFDKYTDYFPTKTDLLELIRQKQAIVNRKEGAIDGYIIFRVTGRKVNFNYLANKSDDPRDSLMLLHNFYAIVHERGMASGVQWNNVNNVRVRKLHRQFGWKEDGLRAFFYLKEGQLSPA